MCWFKIKLGQIKNYGGGSIAEEMGPKLNTDIITMLHP